MHRNIYCYKNRLSRTAADYLETFQCILDHMIQGMTDVTLTDSISANFITQMIPHHQAAIEMSQNILRYTTDLPLQDIADQIISEQTKSIADMKSIICRCSLCTNSGQALCNYQKRMNQIIQTMFSSMGNACSTNHINADFLREMIPHHKGAVEMSETTLHYAICPDLKPILEAIITSQRRGICQMQQLLRCM